MDDFFAFLIQFVFVVLFLLICGSEIHFSSRVRCSSTDFTFNVVNTGQYHDEIVTTA